jgi:hypothetical protein
MAYLFLSEYQGKTKRAQIYKISGVNEWAVKMYEQGNEHPLGEQKFDSERDAEMFCDMWVGECIDMDDSTIEVDFEPEDTGNRD